MVARRPVSVLIGANPQSVQKKPRQGIESTRNFGPVEGGYSFSTAAIPTSHEATLTVFHKGE